jgi:hypothetical protein
VEEKGVVRRKDGDENARHVFSLVRMLLLHFPFLFRDHKGG